MNKTGENGNEQAKLNVLTHREQEIFDLLITGKAPKEIAFKLNISYDTVLSHQKNLYHKLDVHSINELLNRYSTTSKKEISPQGTSADFIRYGPANDKYGSFSDTTSNIEKINNQYFDTYTLIGEKLSKPGSFTGVIFTPNPLTLEVMKKMSSFSFKALGDGNTYSACIGTIDARIEGENNGYHKLFTARNTETTKFEFNLNELNQSPYYGKPVPFIKENIEWLHISIESFGKFNLKIWDIRFHQ